MQQLVEIWRLRYNGLVTGVAFNKPLTVHSHTHTPVHTPTGSTSRPHHRRSLSLSLYHHSKLASTPAAAPPRRSTDLGVRLGGVSEDSFPKDRDHTLPQGYAAASNVLGECITGQTMSTSPSASSEASAVATTTTAAVAAAAISGIGTASGRRGSASGKPLQAGVIR